MLWALFQWRLRPLECAFCLNIASPSIRRADVEQVREAGWSELQIAEAVHIVCLFAMFNRVANAFGLQAQGLLALCNQQTTHS